MSSATPSSLLTAQQVWTHYQQRQSKDYGVNNTFLHPALQLQYSSKTGVGLIAREDIPTPHTLLLSQPALTHIRPNQCRIKHLLPLEDGWVSLVLMLMYEFSRGSSSSYHNHLVSLPHHFDLPLFWTNKQLKQLQGCSFTLRQSYTDTETEWQRSIQPWLEQHDQDAALIHTDNRTKTAYKRIVALIMSRGFRDSTGQPCLVPILDFCNTEAPTAATRAVGTIADPTSGSCASNTVLSAYLGWTKTNTVHLFSRRPLRKGEAITIEYGVEKGNGAFLERYGFVVEGNLDDTCDVHVDLIRDIAADTDDPADTQLKKSSGRKRAREPDDDRAQKDNEDEEEAVEEEEDAVDAFVDELPVEFITLRQDQPLPPALIQLCATLRGYCPTEQTMQLFTEMQAHGVRAVPLILSDDRDIRSSSSTSHTQSHTEAVQEQQQPSLFSFSGSADAELSTLTLVLLVLHARLDLFGARAEEANNKQKQRLSKISETREWTEDEARLWMAVVLRSSEEHILLKVLAQVKQRMKVLLPRVERQVDDGQDEDKEEDDKKEEGGEKDKDDEDEDEDQEYTRRTKKPTTHSNGR